MPRRDLVRIVLVGDDGVGKSSIITSLIKESFVTNVQPIVPEVTIPPEVTPENVTTSIVDTSSEPRSRQHSSSQLGRAHVICLVYSISDPSSFDRVAEYWLPLFRKEGINVPVILVGNKIDLRGGEVTNQALEEEVAPIMREFKEVETVVECSARLPLNVSEVFYFAQKAVLHPTAPSYDSREHISKPKCSEASKRIFKISDVDKDGSSNAAESNQFQQKCFSTPLQTQESEGISNLVRSYDPASVQPLPNTPMAQMNESGVLGWSQTAQDGWPQISTPQGQSSPSAEGLTELGFSYSHTIFIQQGRMETTWTVSRQFGYGESLDSREDFSSPRFDVPYDCSVESSPLGNQFSTDIFEAYDKDNDGASSQSELDDLFSTSPGNPWSSQGFPHTTITDDLGRVTSQGWLAQWSMMTSSDPKSTLNYMAYLGFSSSPASDMPLVASVKVTRPRKADRRAKKVTRNVFSCYVSGATGSGKTSLSRSFVHKPISGDDRSYEPTTKVLSVVNSVEIDGQEKYSVSQEFGSKYESEMLINKKKLELADISLYIHDSSDTNSFSYISNLRQQYNLDHIPSLFIATKSDLDLAQQRHEVQPDVYCRRLGLPAPSAVSAVSGPSPNLWVAITRVGLNPTSYIPRGPRSDSPAKRVAVYTLTASSIMAMAAVWMRYQGYTFRGVWGWVVRNTGMSSGWTAREK